jgi:hypothetical protein
MQSVLISILFLDTLKYEYLSQVLIDSGCMLLILKLLGLQEVALLASRKTDDDRQRLIIFISIIYNLYLLSFFEI